MFRLPSPRPPRGLPPSRSALRRGSWPASRSALRRGSWPASRSALRRGSVWPWPWSCSCSCSCGSLLWSACCGSAPLSTDARPDVRFWFGIDV